MYDSTRSSSADRVRSTTIVAVQRHGKVVVAGDGQVTLNSTVVKSTARKVRRMVGGKIVAGFAGSAADGMTLFDRFEEKLKEHGNILARAAVELAKDWRNDKLLRRLDALMIVADREQIFLISGNGDVIQPDGGIVGIGSGGHSRWLPGARSWSIRSSVLGRSRRQRCEWRPTSVFTPTVS
jgi:ATP-dependent HslUV protease subunit HslV